MGIEITYFGSGTLFGSGTKFGYTYDSDTFPTDAIDDVDSILLENGDVYQVTQETSTEDTMGHTKLISTDYFNAYGLIQDITKKDRKIHEMGLAVPGNRKAFFKASYGSEENHVEEGNILTDKDGIQWRVVQVVGERHINDEEVFRVLVLRNIDLEGSS